MSSDLYNACEYNRVKEAFRLLATASSDDVNYRHEVQTNRTDTLLAITRYSTFVAAFKLTPISIKRQSKEWPHPAHYALQPYKEESRLSYHE